LDDPAILSKTGQEQRVLLTHDLDFGELVAASAAKLPSVITFRLRNMRPDNVNRHLQAFINRHHECFNRGRQLL
jgi:predicted nuclease of predicted toxin-antitoxin system